MTPTQPPAQASDEPMRAAIHYPPFPEPHHERDDSDGTVPFFTAGQMLAFARAALKAQPAPTEAQSDSNSPEIEGIAQPSGNTGELAQGEDSARLDGVCYIVEADYHYEGSQPVRVFSEKVCAETFAAALNAYQKSRPRTSWADAEHKQWAASHPAPMFVGADEFDLAEAPFGMPAIPAIPGTKEGES